MQVQPYLFFDGRCEEALEFYKKTLGAKVEMMMRFKDAPPQPASDSNACAGPTDVNKIMHASFRIGETEVMASDGNCAGQPKFEGVALAISTKAAAEAEKVFNTLADGGKVQMPMTKTFFSERFGMVADRFGVSWMVTVAQ